MNRSNISAWRFRRSARRATRAAIAFVLLCAASCELPVVMSPAVLVGTDSASPIRVGAAVVSITPTFPVYLAGGLPYRLTLSVHDDITARAIVIESDGVRIALVALDLIGINYDDVVRIRESIAEAAHIDYVMIAATHTHNAPDVVGIWSPDPLCSESPYASFLRERVVEAVVRAAGNVREATLHVAAGDSGSPRLSRDTRDPEMIDDSLTIWQARDATTDAVIVTSVHYASHPILIPSFNFEVSGDFPFWMREALEAGADLGGIRVEGFGGICAFFQGALGGRIAPANAPRELAGSDVSPAHASAQSYGLTLARRVRELWDTSAAAIGESAELRAASAPLDVSVENPVLNLAMRACFVDRAIRIDRVQSEVAIVRIGPMEFFAIPGMLMPELVTGELSVPNGADFPDADTEVALRSLQRADYLIVVGLANDMLGYLIPESLWDARPPYATADGGPPYGEIVSAGPGTARQVMTAMRELAE